MSHPAPGPAAAIFVPGIPEACPPGEGMVWSGCAAFDVAPLDNDSQGFDGQDGSGLRKCRMTLVDVGQC
jgi:hypothetical protein